jgi:hypothetical protein
MKQQRSKREIVNKTGNIPPPHPQKRAGISLFS